MRRHLPLWAAALLLSGCSSGRATPEDYLAVVRQAVPLLDQDARENALGREPRGPLWVDVRGFAGRSLEVTGVAIAKEEILTALGPRVREAMPQQVLLQATEEDLLGGTWVREYGVHISPNAARGTRSEITMLIATYTTDRTTAPTSICERVSRLRFRRQESGDWVLADRMLTRPCVAGEAA